MKKKRKSDEIILKDLPHQKLTFGQKAADKLTKIAGSWEFIFFLIGFIIVWIILNIYGFFIQWDPWPFIILNLFLSCLAAIQAPIILMSQNREAERDRKRLEYDYIIDRRSQRQIENIEKELKNIKKLIKNLK
ncbi:MAG: DUF1003 domain-containing protein [Candidatus Aenigmarchaeota archaeon]|nr:DUF1003 domain-containing protein [Candidatus Aenigmarchaeota archaeon]